MDMVGRIIGRLRVVGYSHSDQGKYWFCECECGKRSVHNTSHLNEAETKGKLIGCECARYAALCKAQKASQKARTVHGLSHTKLSVMYDNMMKRCYRPTARRYERYGGRGIRVCDEWRDNRSAFYRWALKSGWHEGLSIDRIDVEGHYSPENCRFIPIQRQASNTSRNRYLEWNGRRQTVSDWARELGVKPQAVQHRMDRGWNVSRIFTQPFRGHRP